MEGITIRFWGVRGSIAVPGESTAGVGGNTSCVEILCGERRFIMDAGTGLRALGDSLTGPVEATLLLSHLHWDHIQGLPFFTPLYSPRTRLRVMGAGTREMSIQDALALQMRPPTFPIEWEDLASIRQYRTLRHGQLIDDDGVEIRCAKLNHPGGGVMAYRLSYAGRSVVYATDTEHYECVDPTLRALAEGADVLIYDSMYTPAEYCGQSGPSRVGWGHSTYEAGAALAEAAGVGQYLLFHHDPSRDDAGVAKIESSAQSLFPASTAAREGMTIALAPSAPGARDQAAA